MLRCRKSSIDSAHHLPPSVYVLSLLFVLVLFQLSLLGYCFDSCHHHHHQFYVCDIFVVVSIIVTIVIIVSVWLGQLAN